MSFSPREYKKHSERQQKAVREEYKKCPHCKGMMERMSKTTYHCENCMHQGDYL